MSTILGVQPQSKILQNKNMIKKMTGRSMKAEGKGRFCLRGVKVDCGLSMKKATVPCRAKYTSNSPLETTICL